MPTNYTITYDSTGDELDLKSWVDGKSNKSASKIIMSADTTWDSGDQLTIIAKHAMVFDGKGNTLTITGSNFEGLIQDKSGDSWVSQYPAPSTANNGPGETMGESYGLIVKNMTIDGTNCNLNFSKASSYLFCGDYGAHGFPSGFDIKGTIDGGYHPYSKKGPGYDNSGNFDIPQTDTTNRIVFTCQVESVEIKCKNDGTLATIFKRDYESGVNNGPRVGSFFGSGVYGRVKVKNCKSNKSFAGYSSTGYWEILNCFLDDTSSYGLFLGDNINRHYEDNGWNGGWDSSSKRIALNRYIFKNCVWSDTSTWSGTSYCYYPYHGTCCTQGYTTITTNKVSRKPNSNTAFASIEPYTIGNENNTKTIDVNEQLSVLGSGFELISGKVEVALVSDPKWKEKDVLESTKIKNFNNKITFTIMSSHDINSGDKITIKNLSGTQTPDNSNLVITGIYDIVSKFSSGDWKQTGTLILTVASTIPKNTSLTFSIVLKNKSDLQNTVTPTIEVDGTNFIGSTTMSNPILSSGDDPSFSKFKIYESTIVQGELNNIKVVFRPDSQIPLGTQIDISGVKNSTTGGTGTIITLTDITNELIDTNGTWFKDDGILQLTTLKDIPTNKDTSFTFTVRNGSTSSDGFFVDISSTFLSETVNLHKTSTNKIMSCHVNQDPNIDKAAKYFLWFNYGGIVTGPYSEEYAPVGTEGPYTDTAYGSSFARAKNYYVNSQEGHQGTNWQEIYNGGSWPSDALPAAYNNVVIGEKKYNQINFQNLDTLGATSAYDGYLDGEDNQNFFYGWSSRRIKSQDDKSNYEEHRGTRLNGDDGDRTVGKTFPYGTTYGKTGATGNTNDTNSLTNSLTNSKEFNKEYFIEHGRLFNNHDGTQLHGNATHEAKYLSDTTLGLAYKSKTLTEKGQQISFKYTLTRHPPIWQSEMVRFLVKEIKESNNAQEAFNKITVRLKPNQDLMSGEIIISDLSGTLTHTSLLDSTTIDVSGTTIFEGDSGNWTKDVDNGNYGTLTLNIRQQSTFKMPKGEVTEFNFVLINSDKPQDKVKPKVSASLIDKVEMDSGDGILDASMSKIYIVDIFNQEYRLLDIKNNVFENELDFLLTAESYKVKFDFTDPSITNFENERFKFDLSGPNFSGPLDDTLVKVYSDISCVILDISKNINQPRDDSGDLNKGLSGEDIIIFDSSNNTNTVDNSGVIFINEPFVISDATEAEGSGDNAKVVLKEAYVVPENIKKRFVKIPVTKEEKKKNNLLRHRTIENIFKAIPNIQVFKTTPEEIGITSTEFKKSKVKVFKIKADEKKVSIVISEETDNDTGFYVPLSSGETVSFQKNSNSTEFDIIRTDVDGEARYTTTGTVSQTSGNYATLNYFVDDETAVINRVGLYFGGVQEGDSPEDPDINKCVQLTNCCSCDGKTIKKDESTLTENTSNTSRRMTWARLSAFNRKSGGRAAGSAVKKCEIFNFNIPRLTKCQKQRSWDPKNERWVLKKY